MELIITFCFWLYLLFFATDLTKMSRDQIKHKIWFDLIQDVENYDHSVPVFLLLVEYALNNIPYSLRFFLIPITSIDCFYIVFQSTYCLTLNRQVYNGVDWVNDPQTAFRRSVYPIGVSFVFAFIFYFLTQLKHRYGVIESRRCELRKLFDQREKRAKEEVMQICKQEEKDWQ
mmetsp:Transcript_16048/g.27063  ORF Transcript_16048/g.27063 Transcript_16048/m.27063 type:complete len:173 (-) Transcript_16048:71-589(-)